MLREKFNLRKSGNFMSLELGQRHKLGGVYPRLTFLVNELGTFLEATESVNDGSGYELTRPLTTDELIVFVQVAVSMEPKAELTKQLLMEAEKILQQKLSGLLHMAGILSELLVEISDVK